MKYDRWSDEEKRQIGLEKTGVIRERTLIDEAGMIPSCDQTQLY